ncbi:MAG: acyltransferase family protein [Thermomonas sp.]|uniref:acyltransferase family protein n=1 Tax=Thermomonas sp. TaxID=1971895 RepID=UPI0039E679DC
MNSFRPDIEGLRAIAILLVVAAHAGVPWLAGGFVGVDVFFVLSGFLITGKLVQEVAQTGNLKLLPFYVRRLRRLLPALLLMLLIVGMASTWLLSPSAQLDQFSAARMAALWLSNFHFALGNLDYFDAGSETNLYLHTWSLGVEEQFYLVWPALVIWLLARDGERGVARLKIGMVAVAAASLLACLTLTRTEPLLAFYMMPMRAWQFATGALAWLVFTRQRQGTSLTPRLASVLGVSGLMLIVASGLLLDANRPYPGACALVPTLGTGLIVLAGSVTGRQWAYRVLSLPLLQWLGRISYSWYLWHWPVLLLGYALTGSHAPWYRALLVVISLGLAALSHALVEAPMRRWRKWLDHPRTALAVSLACMAAIGALAHYWSDQAARSAQSPRMQRYAAARTDAPIIYSMGCDDWYRSANVRICNFGDEKAEHTAVLIGDSHIGQWFPAVNKALDKPGWRLLVMTKSSCPMVDAPIFYARIGREYTECAQWRHVALLKIKQIKPNLLVFGSAYAAYTPEQWTEGTARVLNQISPATDRVFLLLDTPSLPFNGPDCLAAHAMRPNWLAGFGTCAAPAASTQAQAVKKRLRAAATRFPNVTLLDMTAHICPDGLCRAELHGQVVFRDNQHLSGSFAASLATPMSRRLFPETSGEDARGM